MEHLIKAAARFVSKDPDRRVLNGIFFDATNQKLVATDGRRIIVIPAAVRGKDRIIAAHNIKEVPAVQAQKKNIFLGRHERAYEPRKPAIRRGNRISGQYPKWQMVVPKDLQKHDVLNPEATLANLENAIQLCPRGAEAWLQAPSIPYGEVWTALNARFVLDALRSLRESGAGAIAYEMSLEVGRPDWNPVVFRGDNGAFAVIMPGRDQGANCGRPLVFKSK